MNNNNPGNIKLFNVHMPAEIDNIIIEILHSGRLAGGSKVTEFTKLLSEYIGNPYLVPTMEVSSSISLALYMAGVRPGDEVITSPMACLATNEPILNLFAHAVFCDIDPHTASPVLEDVSRKITDKTKALLLFHWAGNPVDMDPLKELAYERGIKVVDDASEALGARYKGRSVGNSKSDYTVFSFYPNRHITTIEGGAISFTEESEWERGRWLARYGMYMPTFRDETGEINPKSDIPEPGPNSYLNNLNAAIGVEQMKHLPDIVSRHQNNGRYYDDVLKSAEGIELITRTEGSESAYWVYTMLASDRDGLLRKLKQRGISASRVHLRNDHYSCFSSQLVDLPGVAYFQDHVISIPCGWWVTDEDREYIADTIKEGW